MIQILLVDDEEIALQMMQHMVDYQAYGVDQVFTAANIDAAKRIIENNKIDILFCDIEMPGGSGLELIDWVNARDRDMIKLIVSAHNDFTFAQKAVELHCYSYLLKPITVESMGNILRNIVGEILHLRHERELQALGQDYCRTISGTEEKDPCEAVREYVDLHVSEELSVEELSAMVAVSQNHLTRLFKKKYGVTVNEYIMEHRLSLAEKLLKTTNKTITMIANDVGYYDYVYFSKLFKRRYGMTPREYRTIIRSEP